MKIAIIIWKLDISGGGQRQALELAYNLQKKGHHVDVFCCYLDRKICYPNLIKKLQVYTIDQSKLKKILSRKKVFFIKRIINKIKNYSLDAENLLLAELVKEKDQIFHYDIFNHHDTKTFMISPLFPKEKNVWMMNDLPFILDIKTRENSLKKSRKGIKGLFKRIYLSSKFAFFLFYFNLYVIHINKIIVFNNQYKKLTKSYFLRDAIIIRSGIDINKFIISKRSYFQNNKTNLLSTSIFFPHRRYEDTIETLNILINNHKITNLHLNIVGESKTDPEYYTYIKSLVQQYSLDKYVSFLGSVSDEKLVQLYQKSDIFIFPNINQTWGLAVFEAMLSQCVAIVSNGCGAHEVLTNKQNAIIVKQKSPHEIASAIKHLITVKGEIERIGKNGQEFVIKNLSWNRYTNEILKVFQN